MWLGTGESTHLINYITFVSSGNIPDCVLEDSHETYIFPLCIWFVSALGI